MPHAPDTWVHVRIEPAPELFIVCPCGASLRLVDDRPTQCECERQYVMTVSVIGRGSWKSEDVDNDH